MIIAPATSNTVAKIALRIGDSLIPNAAIRGPKSRFTNLYDVEEVVVVT